ncbi:hypothetical protein RBG61_02025 [Paludicola sp. MB14-C6]|uniref:hypothetical protein n=1 Tax=Paludihabitans sp. MB14-C6 TaxID=3070656 RepID=UPI0027DB1C94|nr:hypothetical protein [Paludicola sp. MB14-C6]WMJ23469.1 hypothetical protein RBG61_02025 [Paludicola sp. MB14-C6]
MTEIRKSNQEKKRLLLQYNKLQLMIERENEEIIRIQSRAEKITPSFSSQPKGNVSVDKIQKAIEQQEQHLNKLSELMSEQIHICQQIYEAARNLDGTLYLIILYKYIDNMTFEQIAVKLNYSFRQVLRLHGKALAFIDV